MGICPKTLQQMPFSRSATGMVKLHQKIPEATVPRSPRLSLDTVENILIDEDTEIPVDIFRSMMQGAMRAQASGQHRLVNVKARANEDRTRDHEAREFHLVSQDRFLELHKDRMRTPVKSETAPHHGFAKSVDMVKKQVAAVVLSVKKGETISEARVEALEKLLAPLENNMETMKGYDMMKESAGHYMMKESANKDMKKAPATDRRRQAPKTSPRRHDTPPQSQTSSTKSSPHSSAASSSPPSSSPPSSQAAHKSWPWEHKAASSDAGSDSLTAAASSDADSSSSSGTQAHYDHWVAHQRNLVFY